MLDFHEASDPGSLSAMRKQQMIKEENDTKKAEFSDEKEEEEKAKEGLISRLLRYLKG
ncbi:MAG: hypothetical protein NT116_01090 [Candidatus Parcubacteria bacterium]|nr:hypothetical protein [Candidatus Parcubacteria bacterium]